MSQADNRNSSAAKRARTDGSRREDDWTCPSCGNVNFSFRTTCNMRNCTQSRPADHNSKSAAKPLQAPPSYSSQAAAYLSSGAPSSMYLSMPPYGSSIFNGSSLPPYDISFSGGSGYHYDYGNRLPAGSPYGPMHMSGPSPYSSGSMLGTAGMYNMPPMMDRYGLGLPMGHSPMGARPGVFQDDNPSKKAADTTRDSDWTCPNCGNVNFSFRTVCNMRKCSTPKPGSQAAKSEKSSKQKMPEGSWKCGKCNNINYPFRTKCNRQNCGAEKPSESNKSPVAATSEEDDQVCCETCLYCMTNCCLKWLIFLSIIFLARMRKWIHGQHYNSSLVILLFFPANTALFHISDDIYIFSTSFIDTPFSTVPVSTRTLSRVEKVQSRRRPALLYMVFESQLCRGRHVAAVVMLLCLLVISVKLLFSIYPVWFATGIKGIYGGLY